MQKISPCLWFDNNAEEVVAFYVSIFKNAKVGNVTRYGKEGYEIHKREEGTVMTVDFELEGQKSEGGDKKAQQCGWLKDKYGVSWQVVPTILVKMLQDKDSNKSERVMKAMLQMQKLDISTLKKAYQGE